MTRLGGYAKAACEQTDEALSEEVLREARTSGTESPRGGYAGLAGRGTEELPSARDTGSSDRRELVRVRERNSGPGSEEIGSVVEKRGALLIGCSEHKHNKTQKAWSITELVT